jgi:hypothetical protein
MILVAMALHINEKPILGFGHMDLYVVIKYIKPQLIAKCNSFITCVFPDMKKYIQIIV